jgi:hypothetical protein
MLAETAGSTTGAIWQLSFTLGPSGSSMAFSGSDGMSCDVSGTFDQEGGNLSTLNVFDVTMTFSGTCPDTGTGVVSSLGFESSSDYFDFNGGAPGTYLYSASSTSALVFEIFQGCECATSSHILSPERRVSPWSGIF